jgi:hypothetical protein
MAIAATIVLRGVVGVVVEFSLEVVVAAAATAVLVVVAGASAGAGESWGPALVTTKTEM